MEKNPTTIRLANMNLAVHGLEGNIHKAITYYEDPHELLGKCDFVMANPPFNVDEVDAEKVKNDPRLPYALPGVNKKGKVSNGNYLWISYFNSYLNNTGRAGFVMSSQASSAGGEEAKVRRKLIEAGHLDVMMAIRSGFFYTRTVPCELWFLDKAKPATTCADGGLFDDLEQSLTEFENAREAFAHDLDAFESEAGDVRDAWDSALHDTPGSQRSPHAPSLWQKQGAT